MNRRTQLCLALYGLVVISLMLITPAGRPLRAQSATPGLVDYLGAQATANAMATQSAYQQQQAAAGAAQAAAGLQAQAAAAQAQAAAAQSLAAAAYAQATADASQQQARLAAQQATVDAAVLQATVIAQQTRTALEISGQQTREALSVEATRTRTALESRATQGALDATRSAVALQATAEKRDAEAVGTAVYAGLEATRVANASLEARQATVSTALSVVVSVIGLAVILVALLLLGRWFKRQWWQLGRPPADESDDGRWGVNGRAAGHRCGHGPDRAARRSHRHHSGLGRCTRSGTSLPCRGLLNSRPCAGHARGA